MPTTRIRSAARALVLGLACVAMACGLPADEPPDDAGLTVTDEFPLLGHWLLDEETREWLPRACVVLDIRNTDEASLEILHVENDALVRLNDVRETTFAGPIRARSFTGRQLLPTTSTGRFCGGEITVRLRMHLVAGEPDRLQGVWQTPGCELCPDRRFGAERVGE